MDLLTAHVLAHVNSLSLRSSLVLFLPPHSPCLLVVIGRVNLLPILTALALKAGLLVRWGVIGGREGLGADEGA